MKKLLIIVSLALVASFGVADDKNIDESATEETVAKESVTKPQKANMLNLLLKAKRNIQSKNQAANVYTASTAVDASPDDSQYFDFLTSAYNQAVLQLKADIVLKKSGSIAVEEAFKYFHRTVPDDILREKLKKDVDAKITEIENLQVGVEGFFGTVGDIVKQAVDAKIGKDEDEQMRIKKDKIEADVMENIFTKAYNEGFVKEGFDEISGLIPTDTFIITNEKGEVEIGVVGYTTPKSIQLARDLNQGHQSKKTKNEANCKSPSKIADALSNKELLNHFGLKYFYNENCHPSLLAYGMDSFIKEDGMNSDYRNESAERARGMADKFISNFLNSNVSVFKKDTKISKKTKDAMMKAAKQNSHTTYSDKKVKKISMVKEMSQEFTSSSSMMLKGLEDIRIWNVDDENSEIVGVIRYYSFDSIKAAEAEFNPKTKKGSKKAKNHKQKVQHSSNLDVDDF